MLYTSIACIILYSNYISIKFFIMNQYFKLVFIVVYIYLKELFFLGGVRMQK